MYKNKVLRGISNHFPRPRPLKIKFKENYYE